MFPCRLNDTRMGMKQSLFQCFIRWGNPQLLWVNSSTREAILDSFYGQDNTVIIIPSAHDLRKVILSLSERRLEKIRHIRCLHRGIFDPEGTANFYQEQFDRDYPNMEGKVEWKWATRVSREWE